MDIRDVATLFQFFSYETAFYRLNLNFIFRPNSELKASPIDLDFVQIDCLRLHFKSLSFINVLGQRP